MRGIKPLPMLPCAQSYLTEACICINCYYSCYNQNNIIENIYFKYNQT